jgi:inner membrane protein
MAYDLVGWGFRLQRRTRVFLFCALLAMLPDFDFLFGIIEGDPNKYHHDISHSLFFGLVVSIVCAAAFFPRERFWIFTVLFFSAYLSHLLLDFFSLDRSEPYGMKLLWPFSGDHYIAPRIIFSDIRRVNRNTEFFQSVVTNTHNYWAVLREILILAPPALVVRYLRKRREGHGNS